MHRKKTLGTIDSVFAFLAPALDGSNHKGRDNTENLKYRNGQTPHLLLEVQAPVFLQRASPRLRSSRRIEIVAHFAFGVWIIRMLWKRITTLQGINGLFSLVLVCTSKQIAITTAAFATMLTNGNLFLILILTPIWLLLELIWYNWNSGAWVGSVTSKIKTFTLLVSTWERVWSSHQFGLPDLYWSPLLSKVSWHISLPFKLGCTSLILERSYFRQRKMYSECTGSESGFSIFLFGSVYIPANCSLPYLPECSAWPLPLPHVVAVP